MFWLKNKKINFQISTPTLCMTSFWLCSSKAKDSSSSVISRHSKSPSKSKGGGVVDEDKEPIGSDLKKYIFF